ncbi:hypothetical protein [Pseudovibrio sp. Ad26]|uniref:hypothetical protein n=1 Tax=Pseudovibrio sp. Ad26 TaxID=989410 RepID=UPI0007AE5AF8|nr:hypothetical protein [Pseudovibrio sp. Ad26]KZL06358.1 hypothetical protein PsAD26_03609 [Pseudovibrio sp. Ad26]
MCSKRLRRLVFGGVTLVLSGLMTAEATAFGGVLITPSFCDDFLSSQDVAWAEAQKDNGFRRYTNLFYMREGGEIVQISGFADFPILTKLFITSHGSCAGTGSVSEFSNADFARYIAAAQQGNANLRNIKTVSCQSATPPQLGPGRSLLGELQTRLSLANNAVLSGWPDKVAIVGGGGDLANAHHSDDVDIANTADVVLQAKATSALETHWELERVVIPFSPIHSFQNTFKEHCTIMLKGFETDIPPSERQKLYDHFMEAVTERFMPRDPLNNPIRSFAYQPSLLHEVQNNRVDCGPGVPSQLLCP